MAYCTLADIERRITSDDLVRLADHDGDGLADAAVVTQAIEDAQGVIDSYLGVVYAVPIPAPIPDVLRQYCVTMAVYFLCKGRRALTPETIDNYDKAIAWLKAVVAGTATLGIPTPPAPSSGAPSVEFEVKDRVFGRDEPL